jgi:hypothetical protein
MRDNGAMMRSHPREKIGRNDPCPCGSGRKYKHCCLFNKPVSTESPWSRQHDASDRLTDELMKFAARKFGEQLNQAWMDFNQLLLPDSIEKYPGEQQIFYPYFLFDWDPDLPRARRGRRPKPGVVAQEFLLEKASQLPELERLILEQSIIQPISFHEVIRCDPGHGMVLRDVLIGGEAEVEEHSASKSLRPGDLAYAQLCHLPEVTALSRMAPFPIPPDNKAAIVALRARLRRKIAKQNRDLAAEDLIHYREDIRTVYLDIRDALHTPPKLANTDGDPIVFHTLTFKIGSAQVAFDALAPLAWGESKENLLDGAELNNDGTLGSVEIPWIKKGNQMHKTWDNTILGHLKISGRSLVAEVNSTSRAKRIREEIERRLGLHAIHLSTNSQTPEEMLKKSKQDGRGRTEMKGKETDGPQLDPEALSQFAAQVQEQVEGWIHEKIPALGGRTPLQAVADPDGREIVESLLLGWERHYEKPGGPGWVRPDIDAVRRLLKLPVALGTTIH